MLKKKFIQLGLLTLILMIVFGVIGILMILIMQLFAMQTYAKDSMSKHGISEKNSSRLGGLAITLGFIAYLGFYFNEAVPVEENFLNDIQSDHILIITFIIFSCFFLGFIEDLRNNLIKPKYRLVSLSLILLVFLLGYPDLVQKEIGFPLIDIFLNSTVFSFFLFFFFSLGFVNAVNSADGANGLVSGIFAFSCLIFSHESQHVVFSAGFFSSLVFLLFNIASGKLFLGDSGAYGIGACLLVLGLVALDAKVVSLPFLAALYFYPCFDFLVVISRRIYQGKPLMKADDHHLHNKLYLFFSKQFRSRNLSNSLTGLTIALGSSGIVTLLYLVDFMSISSANWLWIFLCQCLVYFFLSRSLTNYLSKQHSLS